MPIFKDHNRITQDAILSAMIANDPDCKSVVVNGVCFTLTLEWMEYLRQNPSIDPYDAWGAFHAACLADTNQLRQSIAHFSAYKTWFAANHSAAAGAILEEGAKIVSAGLTVGKRYENERVNTAATKIAEKLYKGKMMLLCVRRNSVARGQYGHTMAFVPFLPVGGTPSVVFLDVSAGVARVIDITLSGLEAAVKQAAGKNAQDISYAHISSK